MTSDRVAVLVAPAKLTVWLEVVGRRPDGYHDIRAEMVALDLFDRLVLDAEGNDGAAGVPGIEVVPGAGARAEQLADGSDNLVLRALAAAGRAAAVRVEKRIPVGGGLGGGSADAAAVLRWAGVDDLEAAVALGGDVPFCLRGGRALVEGIGERVTPLDYEPRAFVLVVPPFGVDTRAVYERWDELAAGGRSGALNGREDRTAEPCENPGHPFGGAVGRNGLTQAALDVEPRLAGWRDVLGEATGRTPVLAGSGSTWFVEGSAEELGVVGRDVLVHGGERGSLVPVRTVPAGWTGPVPEGRT